MKKFQKLVYTPSGLSDPTLAIAACRAGGVGILNMEIITDPVSLRRGLGLLHLKSGAPYGLKLKTLQRDLLDVVVDYAAKGLRWLIVDCRSACGAADAIRSLRKEGVRVLVEVLSLEWPEDPVDDLVDGLVLKGNEAGGRVGEYSTFILLQKWRRQCRDGGLELFVHGGVTPQVAAACGSLGVSGGVMDSQVLLMEESPLRIVLRPFLERLSGSETIAVGESAGGGYFRYLLRRDMLESVSFSEECRGKGIDSLEDAAAEKIDWQDPSNGILPVGQDACFAAPWAEKYGRISVLFRAIDLAVGKNAALTLQSYPMCENSPLSMNLGTRLPVVQGPMARVSDIPAFAIKVADDGALPVMALALMRGERLSALLERTAGELGNRPWGVGLLGFAPADLLREQFDLVKKLRPAAAVLAGGRPDQARRLEEAGISTFLHVPSPDLIPLFIEQGVRRFILEGRECGGHIGPLSSFVLWSGITDRLADEIELGKISGEEVSVLFAGGIHDSFSSAIAQVVAAPLIEKGVHIGIQMGSGYLFTREIVEIGAIVPVFQEEVVACSRTVVLESGPHHECRCSFTPFAGSFLETRNRLMAQRVPAAEIRKTLDDLIMGRLCLAAKGYARRADGKEVHVLDLQEQQREGMYMVGELATLRSKRIDIPALHRGVTVDAYKLLHDKAGVSLQGSAGKEPPPRPADIAVIGMAAVLPKSGSTREYWKNILNKVEAISEIPSHRWDWHLYFDEDRNAKDRIYSKWGGFLEEMIFDPVRYGMPPKSIKSIDPMQLMALEVARRTLEDAGYGKGDLDGERASVIIGASGGTGDVGMQYGLRAELPRFHGDLPPAVSERLPEWTEDSFPGILPNVIAGRIANRLDLRGVNFTTDAACASSMAALYQAVSELVAHRSDFVIVGGVDTAQDPFSFMCFSKTQALSPSGKCRTFDVSADGIVISEGIAMVALKRLDEAERDGDRIYAIIKGIGGSSDGKAKGLTAPLPAGQVLAMRRAYEQAGFSPATVELFEAHGTGTVVGDTAELESTTSLLRQAGALPLHAAVGSVKTLIGHTKATAGIAGLIKSVLALYHHVLPPHAGVERPNSTLMDPESPLYLVDEAMPWIEVGGHPRRAAASAFGFGGTNFHVVMEEYAGEYRPWLKESIMQHRPAELCLFSGCDRKELISRLEAIIRGGEKARGVALRDVAYNLARGVRTGKERVAVVAKDLDELLTGTAHALARLKGDEVSPAAGGYDSSTLSSAGKVAVLFPGQGAQYVGMFRELAVFFPVIAEAISDADDHLGERFEERHGPGSRLSRFIFPKGTYDDRRLVEAGDFLKATDIAQPALGAVEAGLWRLMTSHFGLKADMLGGHSYGEFSALFAGGVMDFPTFIRLSEARGRYIVDAVCEHGDELGGMAAVMAPREVVGRMIDGMDDLVIANHNAPEQTVISGSLSALGKAVEIITEAGLQARGLPVAAAFHSRFVEPAKSVFAESIRETRWNERSIPVYSNTTGCPHDRNVERMKDTMIEHLVRPVEFVRQVEAMHGDGARIFVELGPGSILTRLVDRILEGKPHQAFAVDAHGGGVVGLLHLLGRLFASGLDVEVRPLFEGRGCRECDPDDLRSLVRAESVPAHAWLLNGSGARPSGTPVRQVGALREGRFGPDGDTERPETKAVEGRMGKEVPALPGDVKKLEEREGLKMVMDRHGRTSPQSEIMSEYFLTMRRFLDTQESIMSQYISGRTGRPRRASLPLQRLSRSGTEMGVEPSLGFRNDLSEEKPTGGGGVIPESERPVGRKAGPVVAEDGKHTSRKPVGEVGIPRSESLEEIIYSIVEEKTGYPREMVGLDQDLEADLGIDSI
ncbi:MAG: acyltransferase domain-containing protein, partial [Deltaproteobacteria bacterium]|nr:acyltransferase domain-containing protein [Deltaproteobacteria bacterium]